MRSAVALLLLAAAASSASAERTLSLVRFEDEEGLVRRGAYIGDNRARLLDESDRFDPARPFEAPLTNDVREIRTLLSPIDQPNEIYAIGLNYWGHINATNMTAPLTPSLFFKNRHAYNHPFASVVIPPLSSQPDYEGELGIVLSGCKDVSVDAAVEDCVAGYTVCHDVSARCYQIEQDDDSIGCPGNGDQFSFSKSFDTHAPIGPTLVSPELLGDASGLNLTTTVNGELRQDVSTSDLIFGVREIVSFLSTGTTLDAGSVICTGTPDGVGMTLDPPTYLQDGDVVEITISDIGTLSNPIERDPAGADGAVKIPAATVSSPFYIGLDGGLDGHLPRAVIAA